MTNKDPQKRPTAAEALDRWKEIRKSLPSSRHSMRLTDSSETIVDSIILGAFHMVVSAARFVGQLLGRR